jgi:cytochrome c5
MQPTRVKKTFVYLCVFVILAFCSALVISEAASTPEKATTTVISAGKVPVNYLEPEAYSADRLAEGKAMFEEKCAICHTDSGRDLVYFGDPDFNAARVIGSVKKFVGAATDPEIGEKVYEYLRYNNDGPFTGQNTPFLQPGPLSLEPGVENPILTTDKDFWGSLTGHKIPTPDDVNMEKIFATDMTKVALPYPIASWAEFMSHEVPVRNAVVQTRALFNMQRYDLSNLPLKDHGLGLWFNYGISSIYTRNQFGSHDFFHFDHSKDALEAMYSTSYLCWLGVLDFEYGLPQRVNGDWNGEWAWGPYENQILWGPGSNLDNLNTYGINRYESISSRELYRNKWTQYSTMFVTGGREDFQPSPFYWYATMPWGCKTYDAGTFGGPDVQFFTGLKGFSEMWNHSQKYPGVSYPGTQSIPDYGAATRKYLIDMYWQYEGIPYYSHDKQTIVNPFLEVIYRQWMAAIGVPDSQLRTLISDSYNLPDGDRDQQRYEMLVRSFENLQGVLTEDQKAFVKAYIRRLYPTNPAEYSDSFTPYKWDLVDPAPDKPVLLPFGSDTAVAGEAYELRILRAQAKDGDIEISASNLPAGAELVKTAGNWRTNDFEYAIKWTPSQAQSGKAYTVTLTGSSNMGTTTIKTDIKVISGAEPVVLDDIPAYTAYEGQALSFPLTVQNNHTGKLDFAVKGSFGTVINNAWDSAGIYTVKPGKADVGKHTVTFTVKDEHGNISQKDAEITVLANSAPAVTITPNGSGPGANKNIYRVKVGNTLRLNFNVTDADGDRTEISKNAEFPGTIYGNVYSYTVEEDMAKYFPGPNVLTFVIKDLAPSSSPFTYPEYKGGETKKVLLIYFEPADADPNHTPWSMAGNAQTVSSGTLVTLDGSGSDDTDKDPISYQWTQAGGTSVVLSDPTAAKPAFTAPKVTEPTILKFYLKVTDPGGLSDVSVVRVKVNP